MAVNVVIPAAGRCPAAAGGARYETNLEPLFARLRFIWLFYKKRNAQTGWPSRRCTFGRSRCAFYILWRKLCKPATDPGGSDRGPGERVGKGVIYQ